MKFQSEPDAIRWKTHFTSPPAKVFDALATDVGRATFWAESAPESGGQITFNFMGHSPVHARVLERRSPRVFALEYFGADVRFSLEEDGAGGTDLSLVSTGVAERDRVETIAGWVSVLLAMKAAVDHGVDLRNHDEARSWQQGYADN